MSYLYPQRHASIYRDVGLETLVDGANPHQLITILFEALQQTLRTAENALGRRDVAAKGAAILKSVRIIEEGLKSALNQRQGGELASNFAALYDYCGQRLTQANLNNDLSLVQEVKNLIHIMASGWQQIDPTRLTAAPISVLEH